MSTAKFRAVVTKQRFNILLILLKATKSASTTSPVIFTVGVHFTEPAHSVTSPFSLTPQSSIDNFLLDPILELQAPDKKDKGLCIRNGCSKKAAEGVAVCQVHRAKLWLVRHATPDERYRLRHLPKAVESRRRYEEENGAAAPNRYMAYVHTNISMIVHYNSLTIKK
ncbi:hypothetical protein HDU76_005970 [Blyttiomyces sp. JEL0837]|nr:hypothetical protein HDU76_005970 [Blyttiomyces sp. JEL0837]